VINPAKTYKTREGGSVIIRATDHDDPLYPVIASVRTNVASFSMVYLYSADGRYEFANGKPHRLDLVLSEDAK